MGHWLGAVEESEIICPCFLSVWRQVVVGWLEWLEERSSLWVRLWQNRIGTNVNGREALYHESELSYDLNLFVPVELGQWLAKHRTR